MKKFCEKYKKLTFAILAVCFLAWLATFIGFGPTRDPAAVQNQDFFEMFKPESTLHSALNKEIVSSLKVAKAQREFQIQVRNFLVKESASGESLCGYFNEYKLTFEAEGIASSGERPTLEITSPCVISDRTKLPVPVRIPIDDIFKLKPVDTDISFKVSENTTFSFKNIYDTWPEYWVLSKIEFDHTNSVGKKVIIERKEIFELSQKPIVMDWAPF